MPLDLFPSESARVYGLLCVACKKSVAGVLYHLEHETDLDVGKILNFITGENIKGKVVDVFLGINL